MSTTNADIKKIMEENAKLKAENKKLEARVKKFTKRPPKAMRIKNQYLTVKEQVLKMWEWDCGGEGEEENFGNCWGQFILGMEEKEGDKHKYVSKQDAIKYFDNLEKK